MFEVTHFELGIVPVFKEIRLVYPYTKGTKITEIISPCGCSAVFDDSTNNQIVILYTPQATPVHLRGGPFTTSKIITVKYNTLQEDGTLLELPVNISFTSTVTT